MTQTITVQTRCLRCDGAGYFRGFTPHFLLGRCLRCAGTGTDPVHKKEVVIDTLGDVDATAAVDRDIAAYLADQEEAHNDYLCEQYEIRQEGEALMTEREIRFH